MKRFLQRIGELFRLLVRCIHLRLTVLWKICDEASTVIANRLEVQHASSLSEQTAYCPRCGQRPDGDRRFEEARELVFAKLDPAKVRRCDVDFALAFHYWKKKII